MQPSYDYSPHALAHGTAEAESMNGDPELYLTRVSIANHQFAPNQTPVNLVAASPVCQCLRESSHHITVLPEGKNKKRKIDMVFVFAIGVFIGLVPAIIEFYFLLPCMRA